MNDYDAHFVCEHCKEKVFIVGDTFPEHQCQPKAKPIEEKPPVDLSDIQPMKVNPNKRKSKWRYMGLIFDSKDEAQRYGYLKTMQDVGVIRHLRVQPQSIIRKGFNLTNPFYLARKNGVPRSIPQETYTPDYAYVYNGLLVIEDVKGIKNVKDENGVIVGQQPYSKTDSDRSQKHLLYRYNDKHHVVFMLTCLHRGVWRYFQASYGYPELSFTLKAMREKDIAA